MNNIYNFHNDKNINKILNECWVKCYNDIEEYNLRKVEGDMYPLDFLSVIEQTYELEEMINNQKNMFVLDGNLWEHCNLALIKIVKYLCNESGYKYKIDPYEKDNYEIVVYKGIQQSINIIIFI